MRIAIIGYSGAGKSTLAKQLGKRYACPVLHLDKMGWAPGWVERDLEEGKADVVRFLDENDSWIVEGNWGKFDQGRRFDEADWIIFLDYPRRICLPQALKRYRHNRGRTRDDMADGCLETFDLEFLMWIMVKGRTKQKKRFYRRVGEKSFGTFVRARSHDDLGKILADLP